MKSLFVATVIAAVGSYVSLPVWSQVQTAPAEVVDNDAAQAPVNSQSLISANSLQGATILGKSGESVGMVERICLDPAARNVHLVVNVGGVLGIGAKQIAIPLAAIHLQPSEEAGDTAVWLRVEATSEQLAKAPPLEARDRLELTDADWVEKNARFFGVQTHQSTQPLQPSQKLLVLTSTQLIGHSVVGQGDTATIAQLDDILFGFGKTPVEYAILSYGGTLGIGRQHVAIPFREVVIKSSAADELEIAIPHNSKTLAELQHVTPSDYPELKLRSVRRRIEN